MLGSLSADHGKARKSTRTGLVEHCHAHWCTLVRIINEIAMKVVVVSGLAQRVWSTDEVGLFDDESL